MEEKGKPLVACRCMTCDFGKISLRLELVSIMGLAILAVVVAHQFDFLEKIYAWSRQYESYQVDELFSIFVVTSIGLAIFSFRRWQEQQKEKLVLQELIAEKERMIGELQEAHKTIKVLGGLLPICAYCKKIRNDQGNWQQLETYVTEHSEAVFNHGVCPECRDKLYLEIMERG